VRQDKKRFEKAEASLDELYAKIVATVGKPDQEKQDKSCAYASREFEKGPLGCAISVSALYENTTFGAANSKMTQITPLISNKVYPGPGEKYQTNFVPLAENNNQSFAQDYKKFVSISCAVDYIYPAYPSYSSSPFQTKYTENFQIELSCGGSAKAEHYPVSN
jgi:hypothetical protein